MKKTLALLINPGAGSVPAEPDDAFIRGLTEAVSWAKVEVRLIDCDFGSCVDAVCRERHDYIAVAGGDGTARAVCEIVARENSGCVVIPLPLGTANILPKRLYGERDAKTVLREAGDYRELALHAGEMNGQLFFVAAAVGFLTSFAEAREIIRDGELHRHLGELWSHLNAGMLTLVSTRLDLYADGSSQRLVRTGAVVLSPGGIKALLDQNGTQAGEPRLEVITTRARDVREVASIGLSALMRRWRDHPRIRTRWVNSLKVDGREKLDIMLDGEPMHMDAPVEFTLRPEAVRFLAAE